MQDAVVDLENAIADIVAWVFTVGAIGIAIGAGVILLGLLGGVGGGLTVADDVPPDLGWRVKGIAARLRAHFREYGAGERANIRPA